ncbi:hypothetical protein MSAN_02445800 [Mycena sanguinolenta]|uniref:Uncharacterized protein n=1 Tax=Mycena sanguinolenta TaxID=230812 RepID=A0A8H7CC45_9AGAR|nr:hypothetical protein MSAN_02445800 [Mycena sanguinolenta]
MGTATDVIPRLSSFFLSFSTPPIAKHRRPTPSHRWLIFGSHDRVLGADEDDASAHLTRDGHIQAPHPDLLPTSASSTPGPSTTQPSPSSSHADCGYARDARGDRTRQGYIALSMSASGECTSRSRAAPPQTASPPPSLAPPPRRRSKPTSRRAILENLIGQLTSKDPYNATVLAFVDGQSSRMSFCEEADAERAIEKRIRCSRKSELRRKRTFSLRRRPGARQHNPNANPSLNPNANAVGGTMPALLKGMKHGAPAGFGCRALQLLLPRPSSERESVRAAVEARTRTVRLRVVIVGGSYGGANGSSCRKAYRNAFHSSPSKGTSSAMYMQQHERRCTPFHGRGTEDATCVWVPSAQAYKVPALSTATGTSTSSCDASTDSRSSGLGSSSTGTGTERRDSYAAPQPAVRVCAEVPTSLRPATRRRRREERLVGVEQPDTRVREQGVCSGDDSKPACISGQSLPGPRPTPADFAPRRGLALPAPAAARRGVQLRRGV